MKNNRHKISQVKEGSIAWELELEPGDELISINGETIEDVFDYHYLVNDEYIELLVRKSNGEEWELEIEKEFEEDLGIEFENSLMDEYRSCRNKCVFALLIRCHRECEKRCILKTMILDCLFYRGIM